MVLTRNDLALVRIFNDTRFQFIFFAVVLYLVSVFEYKHFVIERYEYMGFRDFFSLEKSLMSFVIFVIASLSVFLRNSPFIKGLSGLFIVLFLMPILVVFQYDRGGELYVGSSLLLLAIIQSDIKIRFPHILTVKGSGAVLLLAISALILIIPFLLSFNLNVSSGVFLFQNEIYEIRRAIKGDGNIFTSYMQSPVVMVLLPIVAVFGLKQRQFYFTIFAILLSVLMFMMIPQKSVFLGIFVVIFFYFFKSPLRKVSIFTGVLLFVILTGVALSRILDSLTLESLIFRRYLIIPAYLNHVYYEFFDGMYIKYSYSFLSNFFDYPFKNGPTFLIGEAAFGNINTNANNGFLSDSYMNFGTFGVVISVAAVGFLIKLFDSLSIDARFFGLFFLVMNLLRSSALPTILLTHGLWLLIIISFIVLRKTNDECNS